MENTGTNPIIVGLLFILRCLIPLMLMLGVSHLLRRFGLIRDTPLSEEGQNEGDDTNFDEGDMVHDNA